MKLDYTAGFVLAVSLIGGTGAHTVVQAATITVTGSGSAVGADGECSLVEAIKAANTNSRLFSGTGECPAGDVGIDTIELTGDVTLTTAIDFTDGASGLPSIWSEIVVNGNGMTIQRDPGPNTGEFRIFHVGDIGNLAINKVKLRYGRVLSEEGGGIFIAGSPVHFGKLSLVDSFVQDNSAEIGGGISNRGNVELNSSTLSGNTATMHGGGIMNTGTFELADCQLSDNWAGANSGGIGNREGGIFTVIDSEVIGNTADAIAGGIGNENCSTFTLVDSTVSDNIAGALGGGIGNYGNSTFTLISGTVSNNKAGESFGGIGNVSGSDFTVFDSTVNSNKAGVSIGGIANIDRSEVTVINSTISGNTANDLAGAIGNFDTSTFNLLSSTISENIAETAGVGILNEGGTLVLKNSIIANNLSATDVNCFGTPFTSEGNNLDSDGSCNLTASSDLPNTDPKLGELQNNGGPTFTHALLPGSPAADAGDDESCPTADQRGFRRPVDGDGDGTARCDIGGYELLTTETLTVNSTADVVDAIPSDVSCDTGRLTLAGEPECTLRAAIQVANALANEQLIDLPAGIFILNIPGAAENAAATGDLDITNDLVILGSGSGSTIIDGGKIDRVFDILGSPRVAISNVTVQNGEVINDFDEEEIHDFGGGVANQGALTFNNSVIRANTANTGGGISNEGSLVLINSTVSNNTGIQDGGGVANQGASTFNNSAIMANTANIGGGISNEGSLALTNSTVSNNTGIQHGGGIDNYGIEYVENSTISANIAGTSGGGIINSGTLELINSTLSGNQADGAGGAIHNTDEDATATLLNSTVADNSGPGIINDGNGSVSLKNTIVADNRSGPDCKGLMNSLGSNLSSDSSCGLTAPGDLPETDPRLGPLQNNGGTTFTHALLLTDDPLTEDPEPLSPAVDAGDDDDCPDADQRGSTRPLDGDGNGTRSCDIGAFESRELPFQVDTASRNLSGAKGFPDNPRLAYVMIGSPIEPVDPRPLQFLGALGALDPFIWRLFHEDANRQERIEFHGGADSDFNFARGRGYWLVSRDGGRLQVSGVPGNAAEPFTIDLRQGWNQIATPFNFDIDWSGCVVSCLPPNDRRRALYGFQGNQGGLINVDNRDGIMRPMQGYLVFAESDTRMTIRSECALQTGQTAAARAKSSNTFGFSSLRLSGIDPGWRAKLAVAVGRTKDVDNYLGVDPQSADGEDPLDYPEPPPMHGLALYFPHPEWDSSWPYYTADIRAGSSEEPRVWTFQVWTDLSGEVELGWDFTGKPPGNLTLLDVEANRLVPMHQETAYTYNSGLGGVRHFRVTVP